jgi:hypothetical protein
MPESPQPDPRFNEFVLIQTQNAGLFLGHIPDPRTGKPTINPRAARSIIDSLEMIQTKTRGNLTAEETRLLDTALRNLRPLYQKITSNQPSSDAPS